MSASRLGVLLAFACLLAGVSLVSILTTALGIRLELPVILATSAASGVLFALTARGLLIRHDEAPALAASITGWHDLRREMKRSRRWGRSFALLAYPEPEHQRADTEAERERYLGRLREAIRAIDHAWIDEARVYLLLPETDAEGAEASIARIRHRAPDLLPVVALRRAVFPFDGMTIDGLLEALAAPVAVGPGGEPVATLVPWQVTATPSLDAAADAANEASVERAG